MSLLGGLKDKIAQYVDVQVRLIKINFIERTANLLSYFLFAIICLLISLCIILFLGLGLVELFIVIGFTKLASFFLTIGVYALLLVLVIALRKKITRFFASGVINVLTEGDETPKE